MVSILAMLGILDCAASLFYFGLYRFGGQIHFPQPYRVLALIVACATLAVVCADIPTLFPFTKTVRELAACVGMIAALCCAALLFVISRAGGTETAKPLPSSGLFSLMIKTAGVFGTLMIALGLLRVIATPLVFVVAGHFVSNNGKTPRLFFHIFFLNVSSLVYALAVWLTPSIVRAAQNTRTKQEQANAT